MTWNKRNAGQEYVVRGPLSRGIATVYRVQRFVTWLRGVVANKGTPRRDRA